MSKYFYIIFLFHINSFAQQLNILFQEKTPFSYFEKELFAQKLGLIEGSSKNVDNENLKSPIGFDIELINSSFEKPSDVKIKFLKTTWNSIRSQMCSGKADIIVGIQKNPDHEDCIEYTKLPTRKKTWVYYKKVEEKSENILTLEQAKEHGFKIGIIVGVYYPEKFWKLYPDINNRLNPKVTEINTYESSFLFLKQNKIDLFLGYKEKGDVVLDLLGSQDVISPTKNILFEDNYYIGFSKNSKNKDINQIKQMVNKYILINSSNGNLSKLHRKWVLEQYKSLQ